ncbi:hypothetical protein FRC12_017383 [Ceratobasidium sp. 428]|nr:hypothetical protein FRC12_017383 [Ceratobasidium sp. 428]
MSIHHQASLGVSIEGKLVESLAVPGRVGKQLYTPVPNNLLPTEILSQIFTIAVLSWSCVNVESTERKVHPLVVIPSVCATWRGLALSLGSLWCHVDADEEYIGSDDSTLQLHRVELWLERAGEAPLNFHFQRGRSADADVLVDPQLYDIISPAQSP